MRPRTFAAAIGALALTACAGLPAFKDAPPALTPMTETGAITLFEGGCFYYSSCDTYEISVRPNGAFTLKRTKPPSETSGSTTVESKGQLGADAFAAAEAVLREARFETMPARMNASDLNEWKPDAYPCMPHGPGVRVTRRTSADAPAREIYWDTGCRSQAMNDFTARLRAALKPDTWPK
jgi:hypothetical protein